MTSISAPNTKLRFCLSWKNHKEKLIKSFSSLRNNRRFTDVTLAAGGKFLLAHRVILAAYSSYFEELLSLHMESQTIVVLQNVAFEELQMIVDFMYKGEIEIESGKIVSFFDTAESLKIRALMQHQGPEETAPSMLLRIPRRQREAECPAEASGPDSRQASGSREGNVRVQQVHNSLPSIDSAVDLNRLSQSPDREEIQSEVSDYGHESDHLQGEGSEREEHSVTFKNEEIRFPRFELFNSEEVLIQPGASSKSGKAQPSSKQEPESSDVQDFNQILGAFGNNSLSISASRLPKAAAKSRQKHARLSRMHRLSSEKQFKVQRKRNMSKTPAGVETKDNHVDPEDEISPATAQYEQNEVPELPSAMLEDSDTNGNEANELGTTGPSRMANQIPGQGISNASPGYSLRKRTTAVILQPLNTESLPGISRLESSTPELSASDASSVDKRFYCKGSLETHRAVDHNSPKSVCLRCSKAYKWPSDLARHERFECGKEPPFACLTCDKRFYRKHLLKRHDAVHNAIKSVCPRCSKSFKWPSNLVSHQRLECGKEPTFACVSCDKRFYRQNYLRKHCAVAHGLGDL